MFLQDSPCSVYQTTQNKTGHRIKYITLWHTWSHEEQQEYSANMANYNQGYPMTGRPPPMEQMKLDHQDVLYTNDSTRIRSITG